MAKRFTDTEIWDEDWFIDLPAPYQFFWIYLKDKCDHAGIWRPNLIKFKKLYGHEIKLAIAIEKINVGKERMVLLDNGRVFLTGFIPFQYGKSLNMKSKTHMSVYQLLQANEVKMTSINPLVEVTDGVKDKDKDMSLSLKGKGIKQNKKDLYGFHHFWSAYPKRIGKGAAERSWQNISPNDDLIKRILDAIAVQKKSTDWFKDGGKYIPHPATWLNQRRWEDELTSGSGRPRSYIDKIMGRSNEAVRKEPQMGGLPEL